MNPNVESKMNGAVKECQSMQGGTQPEGSSATPQKVDGCQSHYTGHESAPSPGVAGKNVPGSGGGYGSKSGY